MSFYRIPGDGLTIELLLQEDERPEEVCNTDGWVIVHGDGRWAFTLLTLAELNRLMARWKETGETTYFACRDLVLLRDPGADAVKEAIQDLVRGDGHQLHLIKTDDPRSDEVPLPIEETAEGWLLGLQALEVVAASAATNPRDAAVVFGKDALLTIDGPAHLTHGQQAPSVETLLTPALADTLLDAHVVAAQVLRSGTLHLTFDTGHRLITTYTAAPPIHVHGLGDTTHHFRVGSHTTSPGRRMDPTDLDAPAPIRELADEGDGCPRSSGRPAWGSSISSTPTRPSSASICSARSGSWAAATCFSDRRT